MNQKITTWLDYVIEDDNFAAVGFAIQDLEKEGWRVKSITKNKDGKFVIWMARTWAAEMNPPAESSAS